MQLTHGSSVLWMLHRALEQAKATLLITVATSHTDKGMSFIKSSGKHRAQGKGLAGGDDAQRNICCLPRLCSPRKWACKCRTSYSPCNHQRPPACQAPTVHASHCRSCGQKVPQKGSRLKPQKLCFLKVCLRGEENQRNDRCSFATAISSMKRSSARVTEQNGAAEASGTSSVSTCEAKLASKPRGLG